MPRRSITPALADIRQDEVGSIPIPLITAWIESEGSESDHEKLLEPYRITGTVVCSDSSGLSKLTSERPLLEVMQLVSQPKEVIYSYGKKIGGKPIGTWVADNTEMFYPSSTPALSVIEQMVGAQQEICKLTVQVGMTIGRGNFLEIGGALYGEKADLIEEVAESKTAGGEIALMESIIVQCPPLWQDLCTLRGDIKDNEPMHSLSYQELTINTTKDEDIHYPYPFDHQFFTILHSLHLTSAKEYEETLKNYTHENIVILVKVTLPKNLPLLDQLTNWAALSAIMKRTSLLKSISHIKSNGSIGIYLASDPRLALEFAINIHKAITKEGFFTSVGLAAGEVLLFPMEDDNQEIAGGPVNIASKLAEDIAESSGIYIDSSVTLPHNSGHTLEPFAHTISHVRLHGMRVKLEKYLKA